MTVSLIITVIGDSATCIITGTETITVTSFANEFEITDDGVITLERYPTLNANPYALLVKFDDLATPEEVDNLLSANSIIR